MAAYSSWDQVFADARKGKLSWEPTTPGPLDPRPQRGGLRLFLAAHLSDTDAASKVQELLGIVATTEPNEDWVKGGWLTVDAQGKVQLNLPSLPGTIPQVPGLDVAGKIAQYLKQIGLTDGRMWRSLGWIVLGLVLMFAGVLLLLRKPIAATAGVAAKAAL